MHPLAQVPPGLVHGLEYQSFEVKATVAVFLAIALINSLELIALVCWTFRQPRGLYFWSILISSFGIIPYGVGAILHYYRIVPLPVGLAIAYVGFVSIVPLQSVVLYSRLHLVFYNEKFLKVLLGVIITVSVLLLIPTTITTWGSARVRSSGWNYAYNVVERLQVTGFCVMEFSLSSLYIWSTVKLLRLSPEGRDRVKRIMYELLAISFAVMALDVALIVIEYMNLYYLQVCLKVMVYSIKLKLEFAVLGRLIAVTKSRGVKQRTRVQRSEFIGQPVDLGQFTGDTVATTEMETDGTGTLPSVGGGGG
ncbi:hypothetical protein ASPCAL11368 [Aspergillus calidoustus]|uniref:DUF7703 domain-containing protein n=1 Tax=Aspergillus calidoustus TaxID=454130 RepID=A0A0U5CEE1_ASPCI|nr:hypothetical protein ASPCAL11368 [Aspergillus calidoustus]